MLIFAIYFKNPDNHFEGVSEGEKEKEKENTY